MTFFTPVLGKHVFLAGVHLMTIYLPNSPLLLFVVGFLGVFVLFRVALALLRSFPL
jgi:hypothetical protein